MKASPSKNTTPRTGFQPNVNRLRVYILGATLLIIILGASILSISSGSVFTKKNSLILGKKNPGKIVYVPLFESQDLSTFNTVALSELRTKIVQQFPQLVTEPYKPSASVFNGIKEGSPWFSLQGFFYSGPGEQSVQGPSAEGRYILNPLLLVGADLWGLSIWTEGNLKWDREKVSAAKLSVPPVRLYPHPLNLTYLPQERRAEVTYQASLFLYETKDWVLAPLDKSQINFGITAYNARDFGYRFIYLSPKSENIEAPKLKKSPLPITDFLSFQGSLCGNSSGCNHRNSPMPQLDTIKVTALPAKAVFDLWRGPPEDASTPAHFSFTIIIK